MILFIMFSIGLLACLWFMTIITSVYDISPGSLKIIRMCSYLHSHNPDRLSKHIVVIIHLSTFFLFFKT